MPRFASLLRHAFCWSALGLVAISFARAQGHRSLPARPATSTSIAGTVINSVTGEPLEGVHVKLSVLDYYALFVDGPYTSYGALSDAAGRFSINAVPAARYQIGLEYRGFIMVPGKRGSVGASGELVLKPGEQVQDVTLRMAPQAIISGRVLDEYGDPMTSLSVKAVPVAPGPSLEWWKAQPLTNDRGEFRLTVRPGRYYIVVDTQATVDERTNTVHVAFTYESTYHATYYPGVTEIAAAIPVEAKPGRESNGLEIRMARTPALQASGVVLGTAECVSFPNVVAESSDTRGILSGSVDGADNKSGDKFLLARLAPGLYTIYAACSAAGGHLWRSQGVEFTLTDSNLEDLSLVLAPAADIKDIAGRLEWSAPLPAAAQREGLTVKLVPESRTWESASTADVAADGTFEMKVLPDRYRVEVELLPVNGFIKSVQLNGTPAPDLVLDFANGPTDAKLRITLSANGGQVTGWVADDEDGTRSSYGAVVILPDQKDIASFVGWCDALQCEVPLRAEGRYSFDGLRPGKYRLLATPLAFLGLDELREFIKQHHSSGEIVEIKKEGDKISKDLKMPAEDSDATKQ